LVKLEEEGVGGCIDGGKVVVGGEGIAVAKVGGVEGGSGNGNGKGKERAWRWRTDLANPQPFRDGWYRGRSGKFLGGRGGKMLLLAGTDRLDTELTIGQMQGGFLVFFSLL
jgi:protein phosphatase methylesterase 1